VYLTLLIKTVLTTFR